jgi:hypothetical protein
VTSDDPGTRRFGADRRQDRVASTPACAGRAIEAMTPAGHGPTGVSKLGRLRHLACREPPDGLGLQALTAHAPIAAAHLRSHTRSPTACSRLRWRPSRRSGSDGFDVDEWHYRSLLFGCLMTGCRGRLWGRGSKVAAEAIGLRRGAGRAAAINEASERHRPRRGETGEA